MDDAHRFTISVRESFRGRFSLWRDGVGTRTRLDSRNPLIIDFPNKHVIVGGALERA